MNQPIGIGPDQAPRQDGADTGEEEGGMVREATDVEDAPAVADVIRVTVAPVSGGWKGPHRAGAGAPSEMLDRRGDRSHPGPLSFEDPAREVGNGGVAAEKEDDLPALGAGAVVFALYALFVLLARSWEVFLAPLGLTPAVRINLFSAFMGPRPTPSGPW